MDLILLLFQSLLLVGVVAELMVLLVGLVNQVVLAEAAAGILPAVLLLLEQEIHHQFLHHKETMVLHLLLVPALVVPAAVQVHLEVDSLVVQVFLLFLEILDYLHLMENLDQIQEDILPVVEEGDLNLLFHIIVLVDLVALVVGVMEEEVQPLHLRLEKLILEGVEELEERLAALQLLVKMVVQELLL
jgi:hypothetical protein